MHNRGCIHIYCGDGKGKTTAAVGLCVRAAGSGKKVLLYQFLKGGASSEIGVLEKIPGVCVVRGPERMKFTIDMTQREKDELKKSNEDMFRALTRQAGEYDLFVLDEVIYTVAEGLLPEDLLVAFLMQKPDSLEVVMTGQNPGGRLLELADYVSEIRKVKHPYDKGLKSRKGIEF